MIVVGDSGPVLYLGAIGRLGLLQALYQSIVIPVEVYGEVSVAGAGEPGAAALTEAVQSGWVRVASVVNQIALRDGLLATLDRGEASALALAVELQADLVLMDERKGRSMAAQLRIPAKGTLGILIAAKSVGLIGSVRPVLSELERAGLWIGEDLIREVLRVAGEG